MLRSITIALCLLVLACKGNSQEKDTQKEETAKVTQKKSEKVFPVTKTEAEWKAQLTDLQFYILRKDGTENPFTSEWLNNKEKGVYACVGCDTPLFKSETKFDSGTGWPSFYEEIKGNVDYDVDYKIGYKRTEEHCATCGGHLGHRFDDGPDPTGERHCIDGAALNFIPSK